MLRTHPTDQPCFASTGKGRGIDAFAIAHPDLDDVIIAFKDAELEVVGIDNARCLLVDDLAECIEPQLNAQDRAPDARQLIDLRAGSKRLLPPA